MKITKETVMTKTPVLFMDYTKSGYRQEYAIHINDEYTGVNVIIEARRRENNADIKYSVKNELFNNLMEALKEAGHEVDTTTEDSEGYEHI